MLKRIHVNMHVIRRNRQAGSLDPPLAVKTSRRNLKAQRVEIQGPSQLIYSPDKPLACGARVWLETDAPLIVTTAEGTVALP
jgi:hypothetical protein